VRKVDTRERGGVRTADTGSQPISCNNPTGKRLEGLFWKAKQSGPPLAVLGGADVTGRRADGPLINLERLTVH